GPHEEIVQVLPVRQRGIGHTTDLEVTIRFSGDRLARLEIVADSTRHSSYFTQISVYGTGMDAFVRWFPPSLALVAGPVNPLALVANELKALLQLGGRLATGRLLKQRNISHTRLIEEYVAWLLDGREFPLQMAQVLPTLRLLADIEPYVPGYR